MTGQAAPVFGGSRRRWRLLWIPVVSLACLEILARLATQARLLVVVIPHKFQVQRDGEYQSLEARVAASGGAPHDPQLDWNRPERRLAESLEAADIEALFLLEPLRGGGAER